MNVNTQIANAIITADDKSSYDENSVNLLSNIYVLANIVQGTLHECKDMSIEDIVTSIEGKPEVKLVNVHPGEHQEKIIGDCNEDKVPGEGKTTFDIRFHINIPGQEQSIKILINVEAQRKYNPGYDLVTRGIYYGARMISAQRNTEFMDSDYDKIKKVYSLWVCMQAPNYAKNTITEYKIQQEKVYGNFQGDARYDILNVTFICLGDFKDENTPRVLSMLSVLLSDRIKAEEKIKSLEQNFKIPMTRTLRKEIERMCNLSDAIEDRGIEKGIALGSNQTARETAKKLFENGVSYELVRASIDLLSDEVLQEIYDDVNKANK